MALPAQKHLFGIHSFTAINRTTGLPYGQDLDRGILKVIGSASLNYSTELMELRGGSNPNAVAVERGTTTAEITLNTKEYPAWLAELAGATVTYNAAETGGSASAITNSIGTSVVNATTGIASVAVTTAADLKDGTYYVKAVSATTVDVYVDTDIAFKNGTDISYQDAALKITASALTVPGTSGTVAIPNTGITISGGSGTVAFTTGHVAVFTVRSINLGSTSIVFPETPEPIEFKAIAYGQRLADGSISRLIAPRCILADCPVGMTENEFSTGDLTIKVLYDTAEAKTWQIDYIKQ